MLKQIDRFFTYLDSIDKRKLLIYFVIWTIFAAFVVGNAHAAAAPITTDDLATAANSASDPALSAIGSAQKLFGSIALNPMSMIGFPNTVLGTVLNIINMVLMAMGSVWVTWSLVKGSLMTAQEGQFIGKSMHSAWVPFRMIVGTASLVPFFKGLCLAQLIMLFAIQLGIGGGNMAWQAAVGYIYQGNQIVNPNGMRPSQELSQQVFDSLLCVKSVNYGLIEMDAKPSYAHGLKGDKYVFGNTNGSDSACGAFELPAMGNTALTHANYDMRLAAFDHLVKSLEPEAERISRGYFMASTEPTTNDPPQLNPDYLKQVSAAQHEELRIGTSALFQSANIGEVQGDLLESAKSSAKTQGFFTAGTWFFSLAKKNEKANEAVSAQTKMAIAPRPPTDTVFEGVDSIYQKVALATRVNDERQGAGQNDESWTFKRLKMAMCGSASNLQLTLGQCIVQSTINVGDQNQSAIIRLSELGNSIVAIGASGITAVGAAQGGIQGTEESVPGRFATNPVTGAFFGAAKLWLSLGAGSLEILMLFGLVCATYIPLIPAIVWIMRMVSILAQWVEAVVSSSVWAFSHLDTEGEGMGNRSGHGYMFLFSVLLNPMLSVLGLILSMAALDIMSTFLLLVYPDTIANASGDSWTGLLMIIAYLIIFVVINLILVNLCMQLINVVPDNIMDWLGGRISSSIGKNGEDMVSGAAKGAVGSVLSAKGVKSWTPSKPKAEPKVDG